MKIGIIGGGPSGLVFLKELLEAGHEAECFESGSEIGGIFARTYDNARLTSSNLVTTFSDFSDGEESRPKIWDFREYLDYLDRYVEHFNLESHITLKTRVETVEPIRSGGYRLVLRSEEKPNQTEVREFDRVVIGSGTHQTPKVPSWPGMEDFQGKVMHTQDFTSAESLAGKRVLIVGGGESASDISLEVARVAASTCVSIRQHLGHVVWRNPSDLSDGGANRGSSDQDTTRVLYSLPTWMGPVVEGRRFRRVKKRLGRSHAVVNAIADLNLAQGSSGLTRFGTKNASLVRAMVDHGCERRPDVKAFEKDGVRFVDGSRYACDVVILATGFQNRFAFLEEHLPELAEQARNPRRNLYRHCFHPEIGESLVWGGFARPAFGAIPPIAEMQARWFALLCSGEVSLPDRETMERRNREYDEAIRARFADDGDRLVNLTDFLTIMDLLAEEIGCLPPKAPFDDPELWWWVMMGPITGAQYRLRGPGAKPDLAIRRMVRTPLLRTGRRYLTYLCLCRALSVLPGCAHFRPSNTWN